MKKEPLHIAILGLSITSSWGNGHATTYRSLTRELSARGHDVLFLERDTPWYAANRDAPRLRFVRVELYRDFRDLRARFQSELERADLVIVGSYVPEGIRVGRWVTECARGRSAFYDIDTPVTIARLDGGACEYLDRDLIPRYDLYLSFTGGRLLRRLEQQYGSPRARTLYCSFDPRIYYPQPVRTRWDLGYMGTYSADRQPALRRLLIEPARRWPRARMVVAGPQYPDTVDWPQNVKRIDHLAPRQHRRFYTAQRFTLNITRADMVRWGHSPSVRLFEAAACGTPIISDVWEGIEEFLEPNREILLAKAAEEVVHYLRELEDERRSAIGIAARARVLAEHTAAHRAETLEGYIRDLRRQRHSTEPLPQTARFRPRPSGLSL